MNKINYPYLKSISYSKTYPYKICVVCNSKNRLQEIIDFYERPYKIGREKCCGWVGFIYCVELKQAIEIREDLYNRKDLYVFLQYDTPLFEYYRKNNA